MSDPTPHPTKRHHVQLTDELWRRIRIEALETGFTASATVARLIDEALKQSRSQRERK